MDERPTGTGADQAAALPAVTEQEDLAARLSGGLFLLAAATTLVALLLPGTDTGPVWLPVGLALAAAILAVLRARVVPAHRWAPAIAHSVSVLTLAALAALMTATGEEDSPAAAFLWLFVVYVACFRSPRAVALYVLAAGAVLALPLAYSDTALDHNLARRLVTTIPAMFAVAGVVLAVRLALGRRSAEARALEGEQRRAAADQTSLRRVATAVAGGLPPQAVFALVSAEAGRLLGGEAAGIVRYEGAGDRIVLLGVWSRTGFELPVAVGDVYPISPEDPITRMRDSGTPAVVTDLDREDRLGARRLGFRSLVAAPIQTGNRMWGALVLADRRTAAFAPVAARRLADYAELVATAIANAEERARLDTQAGSDALTGLMNHRAFRQRLVQEVARAQRHRRPLTAGIVDVDAFQDLTDQLGVRQADGVLAEIAQALREGVRDEDVVARLAGDGFGVIFVESDPQEAYAATDRARMLVARASSRHRVQATVSAGLCDLELASSPEDLIRRAGMALAHAKSQGGDRCERYDPQTSEEYAARLRPEDLDRWQALLGLRALARTIDAKDPTTQEHSERVSGLAGRLAEVRGWSPEDVALLREAALLHDVGKVGVPDAILLKRGPLDDDEWMIMREHAALGARISADVLGDTQLGWIAGHHERPDGAGYPHGLTDHQLAEGAGLLALADAWDVMTRSRWYADRKSVDEAVEECRRLAGRQFTHEAVAALEVLLERRELTLAAARMHSPG
jgi:diguanylate cyclase (GGDEF)-like protein/putative nucleotidyltransferase with HDIG domain